MTSSSTTSKYFGHLQAMWMHLSPGETITFQETSWMTSSRSFMPSVLPRDLYIPISCDKSMKKFSYLSELLKPLEPAQGAGYLTRGPVLPAPSPPQITS